MWTFQASSLNTFIGASWSLSKEDSFPYLNQNVKADESGWYKITELYL